MSTRAPIKAAPRLKRLAALLPAPVVLATLLPAPAAAQIVSKQARDPSQVSLATIVDLLVNVVVFGLAFVSAIAAIFLVVNGYQYVLSAGNPEKVEKAKQGVTWSIGGFILAISSIAVIELLTQAVGSRNKTGIRAYLPGQLGANGSAASIVYKLGELVFLFAGAVAVLFVILGGYRYVTSQGDPDLAEKAKKTVLYAVTGLAVVFLSFVIFNLVADAVHLKKTNRPEVTLNHIERR